MNKFVTAYHAFAKKIKFGDMYFIMRKHKPRQKLTFNIS